MPPSRRLRLCMCEGERGRERGSGQTEGSACRRNIWIYGARYMQGVASWESILARYDPTGDGLAIAAFKQAVRKGAKILKNLVSDAHVRSVFEYGA
jgi:hypothetical protein